MADSVYVKKSVLSNSYSNGGLNYVDFATLNNTFKINWLRNYLKKPSSIWNIIPEYVFSQLVSRPVRGITVNQSLGPNAGKKALINNKKANTAKKQNK